MEKIQVNDCEDVLLSMRMIAVNLNEIIYKLDKEAIKAMILRQSSRSCQLHSRVELSYMD